MSELQIIDANGRFTGGFPAPPPTPHYRVIAVVGCQSGGKSTLLNAAFRTSFPVLDAPKSGRRRTTLGVWGALVDVHSRTPVVVLDVEGTDSRERGEGGVAFESRTSLFALAVADVVLVNMWAHDVGRHSAANYDLFATVFAHAAALPPPPQPVRLVVVVRDAESDAPVPEIRRVLDGDLRNIWHALKRPAPLFDRSFKLQVVALPHRKFAGEAFEREAAELGKDMARGGVGEKTAHAVPLSAFETYAREVWVSICKATGGVGTEAEFTLDLPRHVAMTAHYKCGEVMKRVLEEGAGKGIEELRGEVEADWRKPLAEFGGRVDAIAREALAEYEKEVAVYAGGEGGEEAVGQRRVELGRALVERLGEVRERYLWVCRDSCMNRFEDEFRPMLGGTAGYERNAKRLANSYVARYRSLVESARLPRTLDKYVEMGEKEEKERLAKEESEKNVESGEGEVETLDTVDMLDDGSNVADSDDEISADEFSVDVFKSDLFRMVEDRRRLGELMLPGGGANFVAAGPKKDPWWKGLLIRGAILLINYLQASQGQRAALKLQRKHEREFPASPTF